VLTATGFSIGKSGIMRGQSHALRQRVKQD
jgi:hypothetical protein